MKPGDKFEFKGYEWITLTSDEETVTAMMAEPWVIESFDDDNSNNWEKSSIRKKIYDELLPELGAENLLTHSTDLVADNGDKSYGRVDDRIWLISCDEFRRYRDIILANYNFADDWLWTVTPWYINHDERAPYPGNGNTVRSVSPTGQISSHYAHGSYGVAPACIFHRASLNSASTDAQKEDSSEGKAFKDVLQAFTDV